MNNSREKNGIVKYCETCGEQGHQLCLEVVEGMELFFLSSCFAGSREQHLRQPLGNRSP